MRRAPAKPVPACILRKLCPVSHVTFEAPLRTQQAFTHRTLTHSAFAHGKRLHAQQAFQTEKLLHTTSFYTEKLLHTASFHTQQAFTHRTLTHSAFTHGKRLHTQKLLHRDAFTHREAFTYSKLLHTKSFTHSKLSHTASVYTQNTYAQCFYTWQAFTHTAQKLLHRDAFTHREAFTRSKLLHTKSFTHSKLLQKTVFTQRSFLVHNHKRNCSSLQLQKTIYTLFKRNLKKKIASAKNWENPITNHYCSLDAAIPIRFTMSSCKRQ